MIIEILVLIALLRIRKPFLCALMYGALSFMGLIYGAQMNVVLVNAAISFVAAFIFFWLLERFDGGMLWWLILITGIAGWVFLRLMPAFAA